MKKFEEKAIPLIVRSEDKKYEVNPQAVKFFSSIQGKIAIISVAGVYRTGKSYLLNTILLNQKAGFAVGPTTNPKTKGIWVWSKPLILKNEKDEIINVCVLDSEGLGSIQQDINHDLRLFSITLLLSSMFIYNTLGSIDEHAIDSLGLVLRLCERLRAQNYNDFPDFYWVLRDFSLALVSKDNVPLSPNKYLQQSLNPQTGDSQVRNKIRTSIKQAFLHRNCFTFVRPLTKQQDLQKLDTLQIDQLRPQFMQQVIQFRKLIHSNIKAKRIKGKQINAMMLVQLINAYTAQINGNSLPQIQTGWKYVCARQCQNAMQIVEKQSQQIINRLLNNIPTTKKQLSEQQQNLQQTLIKLFNSKTSGNDQAQTSIEQIKKMVQKKIKKVQEEMKSKNSQQTKNFIKKQFQNIQKRLKAGQFKGMNELVKQFQVFHQYYRKKCPYKDEIQTGLECLMKKFSDSSLVLFKNWKTKKDQQINKMKEDIDRLNQQLHTKQEKHKIQKTQSSDRTAILQSKLEEISKQNVQLIQQIYKAEGTIENLNRQKEQKVNLNDSNMQVQLINLRKKLMQIEQNLRQCQMNKTFQLNNIKNQLILKDSQLKHVQDQKNLLLSKYNLLITELQQQRQQKNKRIDQLTIETQHIKNSWDFNKKQYQIKVSNMDQQIARYEALLQSKSHQIQTLTQNYQKRFKDIGQKIQIQKGSLLQISREQNKNLKQQLEGYKQEFALKNKKIQSQLSQKQMQLKMHRLEIDRQMAILTQKVQFIRKQCAQKQQKILKLQQQNSCYIAMFQEKDTQILNLTSILDELKSNHQTSQSQVLNKHQETIRILNQKTRQVSKLEEQQIQTKNELNIKINQVKDLSQKIKNITKINDEKQKQFIQKINDLQLQSDLTKRSLQQQLETARSQNSKLMQQHKRNAQLSLVQLKNYYQMQRQRLQKRNLQDRKKHENMQQIITQQLEAKHRKVVRSLQQQIQNLRSARDNLQQQIARCENEWDMRLSSVEEQRQNEKRILVHKLQLSQKNRQQVKNELQLFQKQYEQQRITFVKRIQGLNFQLSRKQKQMLQLNSKKQSLQQSLIKKQTQIDSVKKLMNQQIQGALKKVSDIQTKYQKLNQQYMQYRIETQKQLALAKQRNQFQSTKINQYAKQKQVGSNKTIDRLDKQRMGELKQQNQKLKSQLLSLQGKLQTQRKSNRQTESQLKKQLATLQKDYQFLTQKESITAAKLGQLQTKLSHKSDTFIKQLQQVRNRGLAERQSIQKQMEGLRDKLIIIEDQKIQLNWTFQKQTALLNQRLKFAQYQRDQAKKDYQQIQKRLVSTSVQLRKASQKAAQDSQVRKQYNQKKYTAQIQSLKQNLRVRSEQYQQSLRKMRQQLRAARQKSSQLQQKIALLDKNKNQQKNFQQQNQIIKKEKETLLNNLKSQRLKQNEEWKKKLTQSEKKVKQFQKKHMEYVFQLQKQSSRFAMQKQNLLQKIKSLQDILQWQKSKSQLSKSKLQLKKSDSGSNQLSSTQYSKFSGWKG